MGATVVRRWAEKLAGSILAGRYTLERPLGAGGMGCVFAATQTAVQRQVAVKLLMPPLADNAEFVERFHREAILAAQNGGGGVVEIIDFDRDPELGPFLVMELLQGESLADRIALRKRLSPGEAADIAGSVLATLAAVHARGIVHRDLKPANVFLSHTPEGARRVKLLDFGIARAPSSARADLTRPGDVLGTPCYMPPEQALALPDLDARVDVYAVGAILYECLGGVMPYATVAAQRLFIAVQRGEGLEPLRALRPGLPEALYEVVERSMATRRESRFASAAEMRVALARALGAQLPELAHAATEPNAATQAAHAAETISAPPTASGDAPSAPVPPTGPAMAFGALSAGGAQAVAPPSQRRTKTWIPIGAAIVLALAGGFAAARLLPSDDTAAKSGPPSASRSFTAPPGTLRERTATALAALAAGRVNEARTRAEAVVMDIPPFLSRTPEEARAFGDALLILAHIAEKDVHFPDWPVKLDNMAFTIQSVITTSNTAAMAYRNASAHAPPDQGGCGALGAGRVFEAGAAHMDKIADGLEPREDAGSLAMDEARATAISVHAAAGGLRTTALAQYESGSTYGYAGHDPIDDIDCKEALIARRAALTQRKPK